jgi:hypothetical protein
MSLKWYEREEVRLLHDLGCFSKADFLKDIHSTEQGIKKTQRAFSVKSCI